ncbi:TRAFs-binding domain-containing protein [Fulvivirga lutimaris]|uniref:TRAFs-binding domain-containing protein n=1 Tax=Fulvivirga lutimaris TaxID=1819566 RepID=UPI0012BBB7AB|nr:TRAFs-binding domain-containing protein [Fulvivirga lutimaris]MTI40626.1 DUF4071 domain-containing protein [Fulvivirga lutimaris]
MEVGEIEHLINSSLYFEANRHLKDALHDDPENVKYKELLALSYSRSGALQQAVDFFEPVYYAHKDNPEVAGIMGGIYKRLFAKHMDQKYGNLAADIYEKSYRQTGNYYTGINAASMLQMSGKGMSAKEIAREIIKNLTEDPNDTWSLATLGEAHLLLKNRDESRRLYIETRKSLNKDWSKLGAIYKQLWLINHYTMVPKDILSLFSPPVITVFAGHMIDQPGRKEPRFTSSMVPNVKDAIASAIRTMNIEVGYCSLACGADILFAEEMLEQDKTLYVLIPFMEEDFLDVSVRFAGSEWEDRYHAVLEKVKAEYISEAPFNGKNDNFDFLSKVLVGRGLLHASQIDSNANLLTVLSSVSLESKTGGTRYLLDLWPEDLKTYNVDVDRYFEAGTGSVTDVQPASAPNYDESSVLSYMLLVKCDDDAQAGIYSDGLDEYLTLNSALLYANYSKGNTLSIHFKNEVAAIDCAEEIEQVYNNEVVNYNELNIPSILLHASHATIKAIDEPATGPNMEMGMQLLNAIPSGKTTLTENFTSCVAIKNEKWKFDYAGRLEIDKNRSVPVYHLA